jgi:hypothetical protein
MQSDTKERNFCFVYKGEALQALLFEDLHFQHAEGMYCREDGMWYVRVSLSRNHGRRAVNIPNILDEYNEKVQEKNRIQPIAIPSMQFAINCFKTTGPSANNHILRRIQADSKSNPTYWKWESKPPRNTATQKAKAAVSGVKPHIKKIVPHKKTHETPIKTGLEGLVRDLNLNPNTLDMQGAYTTISRNFFANCNAQLGSSGQFDAKDRDFLLNQLSRYFSKELAFVSKPFDASATNISKKTKASGTIAALVATNGGSAHDFEFVRGGQEDDEALLDKEPNPFASTEPNETICLYFREMLPRWLHVDSVEICTRDIVIALNGGGGGCTYRSTCIPSFLRPFIGENLIKAADTTASSTRPSRYIINVKGMATKLKMVV